MTNEEIEQLADAAVEKRPTDIPIIQIMKLLYVQGFKACQEQSGWISVDEKLPEPHNEKVHVWCLVYGPIIGVSLHPYSKLHYCWDDEEGDDYFTDAISGKITHWQPLPSNPSQHGNK